MEGTIFFISGIIFGVICKHFYNQYFGWSKWKLHIEDIHGTKTVSNPIIQYERVTNVCYDKYVKNHNRTGRVKYKNVEK